MTTGSGSPGSRCRTCELVARRDAGEAPAWDCIVRNRWWDVVHCDASTIKGWIVLVLRRHASAVAELTDDEVGVLGSLIRDVSRSLHQLVGCEKAYVVQFAESAIHRHVHVHVHVIPKDGDLPQQYQGPGVFQLLGVSEDERVSEAEMNELALQLRGRLSGYSSSDREPLARPSSITIEANQSGRMWSEDPGAWHRLASPEGCPICARLNEGDATNVVAATDAVIVTADPDGTLPGYVCVTSRRHVVEPYELTAEDQAAFFLDAMAAARGLARVASSVKMNYEIHGNTIPHLHMHLFPRQPDDPYVGYGITSRVWYRRSPEDLDALGRAIRDELAAVGRMATWP